MNGPIGLKVSALFARQSVRSVFCQPRSLTSLPSVYPFTQSRAFFSVRFFAVLPITATNSPSYSTGPGESAGMTISAPVGISAAAER